MSKPSRRPNRDAIKQQRKDRKKAQKALRKRQKSQGLVTQNKASMSNRKCEYETVEQEEAARVDARMALLCANLALFCESHVEYSQSA